MAANFDAPLRSDPAGSYSAEIIPFPLGRVSAAPVDRLAQALDRLDRALAQQRQAVASWRISIATLQARTDRLGGSLACFQDRLGGLRGSIDALHAQACDLAALAERAERA